MFPGKDREESLHYKALNYNIIIAPKLLILRRSLYLKIRHCPTIAFFQLAAVCCTCDSSYTHPHTHTHTHIHKHMHTHPRAPASTHTHTHTNIRKGMYTDTHAHTDSHNHPSVLGMCVGVHVCACSFCPREIISAVNSS